MEPYKAKGNGLNNQVNNTSNDAKSSEKDSKQKTEELGSGITRVGIDLATGGQWENIRNKPIIGSIAKHGEKKYGKKFANSPGVKAIKKLTNNNQGIINNEESVDDDNNEVSNDSIENKENSKVSGKVSSTLSKKFGLSNILNSLKSSDSLMDKISSKIPESLKIKLIIGIGACFLLFIIVVSVFATDDFKNLELTSNSSGKNPGTSNVNVMAALEEIANAYINGVGTYWCCGSECRCYYDIPNLGRQYGDDCTEFVVAYMSRVCGVDLIESYSGDMVYPDGTWAKAAAECGWKAYSSDDIGDLEPGDVLIAHSGALYSTKGHHAEVYVDESHTFGWGSVKTSYPTNNTITKLTSAGHVHFRDGGHDYITIYRYQGANNLSDIDIENLNITKMNDSSFNHGTKSKSNQKYIVLHDTEMSADATAVVSSWKNSGNGVAAHFVVNRDGTVIQAVDLDVITHHAGWGGPGNFDQKFGVGNNDGKGNGDDLVKTTPLSGYTSYGMNSYSIGIEICHVGGETYTEAQFEALDKLIAYIDSYYGFQSTIIDHKTWRPSNSDVDNSFPLEKYKNDRHH